MYIKPSWLIAIKAVVFFGCMFLIFSPGDAATLLQDGDRKLDLTGDLRLRLEDDWDSLLGNGIEREDRMRIRARARIRLNAQVNKYWSAVAGVRTGSNDSQQSPHITLYDFDGNPNGPRNLNFDLWYAQFEAGGWSGWFGRNKLNFWKQDDLTATDDITVLGMGLNYVHGFGPGTLTWKGGFAALPVGMHGTSGHAVTGEVIYNRDYLQNGFTGALIYFGVDADPTDLTSTELLLTENNIRDYQTLMMQFQYRTSAYDRPFSVGLDIGRNIKDYSDSPINSFSEFHQDDTDFAIAFAKYGSIEKSKWQFGYFYAYIEALAISSSYSQDDWLRWGDVNQTRATNFKGSEFRLAYGIAENMDVVSRLYIVEALELLNFNDLSKEDGKRLRIDLNIHF